MAKITKPLMKFFKFIKYFILFSFVLTALLVAVYRFLPVPTSSYMIQKNVENMFDGYFHGVSYQWASWGEIPVNMKLAVIGSEDQRFAEHFGIDIESIEKALKERRRKVRGASTITQQVARNLFLWGGRSYVRKGLEVYFTLLIEVLWSKERILEVYLNIAEFGDNIYGVGMASRVLFKKEVSKLNLNDCTYLAAVLPNPKRFKANTPSPYIQRRSAWIKRQIYQIGGKDYLEQL